VPGGDVRAYVSGRFKGSPTGGDWACRGRVIIALPAEGVAPFVSDGTVAATPDGRALVEAGSWSWIALAASFGRFDAEIEVVGPDELSDAFAELAGRYAAATRMRHARSSG